MYTACTVQLARALDLPCLLSVPQVFIFFALAAWRASFAGMAGTLLAGFQSSGCT
jgi:hypothetical protein